MTARLQDLRPAGNPAVVPAPSVCLYCGGDQTRLRLVGHLTVTEPCVGCCCSVCGQVTDTPPECRGCGVREEAAAKRRADQ